MKISALFPMTGTTESGSLSKKLIKLEKMELLRYPVHQNYAQYRNLIEQNHFDKAIAYHSPDFSAPTRINL